MAIQVVNNLIFYFVKNRLREKGIILPEGFAISGDKEITLLFEPVVGSNIGITYIN